MRARYHVCACASIRHSTDCARVQLRACATSNVCSISAADPSTGSLRERASRPALGRVRGRALAMGVTVDLGPAVEVGVTVEGPPAPGYRRCHGPRSAYVAVFPSTVGVPRREEKDRQETPSETSIFSETPT